MRNETSFWWAICMLCGFFGVAAVFSGCLPKGAESPDRATARAVILTVARGVHEADVLCAQFARDTKDAGLAKKCADAYDLARPSLIGAEAGVDGWNAASQGHLACLAIDSITALTQFSKVLTDSKVALPLVITDALQLAGAFKGLCQDV